MIFARIGHGPCYYHWNEILAGVSYHRTYKCIYNNFDSDLAKVGWALNGPWSGFFSGQTSLINQPGQPQVKFLFTNQLGNHTDYFGENNQKVHLLILIC